MLQNQGKITAQGVLRFLASVGRETAMRSAHGE
jgi:hypothetical protein